MSFITEFLNVPQQTFTNMHQYSSEATFLPHPLLGRDGSAVLTQSNSLVPSSPQTSQVQTGGVNYDGRRMRNKTNLRKTVDYNASVINWIHGRGLQRDHIDRRAIQPDPLYNTLMVPPSMLTDKPVNCLCTRSIRMAMNKVKCPIFTVKWTPEGRRLITGASSGEFTLWNGLTFSFETILQAHDVAVRSMVWSHGDQWMVTADHEGYVKYWQSNMNNVKMYQIHKSAVRGLSFSPSDQKFASGSDDNTVRIWDFMRCQEEKILRGHGADIRCVDWHPDLGIVVSGSRDTQQPVKLWDVKSGNCIFTIHAHKHTVMDLKWNKNGNWLLTASRDHLLKLFDIRNFKEEVQLFRGHKKEATTIAWHPIHEHLFASGGSDGSIMYWLVGNEKELGGIENAHDTMVWSLDWHPLGHIIASGSNDHTTKFWTRNRPGDMMRDRYNLNTLPYGADDNDADVDVGHTGVPGLDIEAEISSTSSIFIIPGLDVTVPECDDGLEINGSFEPASITSLNQQQSSKKIFKKVLHGKAVPRDFERAWKEGRQPNSVVNQALQFESGFIQSDNEISMMIGDVQEGSDIMFLRQESPHIAEIEHSRDEFCDENRFNDECRSSNDVDYTSQNDFLHYHHDHHVPRLHNGSRNRGGNNYRFSKYPSFNRKRNSEEYDIVEARAGRRPIEFGDESDRREPVSNFSFKNRGRGNRSRGKVFSFR